MYPQYITQLKLNVLKLEYQWKILSVGYRPGCLDKLRLIYSYIVTVVTSYSYIVTVGICRSSKNLLVMKNSHKFLSFFNNNAASEASVIEKSVNSFQPKKFNQNVHLELPPMRHL